MDSGFKQLGRLTLSAAIALGLIGITGSAQAAWANTTANSSHYSQTTTSRYTSQNRLEQHLSRRTMADIQRVLRRDGFYRGRIDGRHGRATQAAIRRFQRSNGLRPTGQLNARTLAVLGVVGQASRTGEFNRASNRMSQGYTGSYGYNSNQANSSRTNRNNNSFDNGQSANMNGGYGYNSNANNSNGVASNSGFNNGGAADRMQMGSNASTVRQVQRDLLQRGFYSGAVDGHIGRQTREAIRKYQRSNHLNVNGQLDQQTLSSLGVD